MNLEDMRRNANLPFKCGDMITDGEGYPLKIINIEYRKEGNCIFYTESTEPIPNHIEIGSEEEEMWRYMRQDAFSINEAHKYRKANNV